MTPTAPQIWDLDAGCDLARKTDITRLTVSPWGTVGHAPRGPRGVRTLLVSPEVSDEPVVSHRHFSPCLKNVVSGLICLQPINTPPLSPFPGRESHVGKGTQSRSWGPWTYSSCGGPPFCTQALVLHSEADSGHSVSSCVSDAHAVYSQGHFAPENRNSPLKHVWS